MVREEEIRIMSLRELKSQFELYRFLFSIAGKLYNGYKPTDEERALLPKDFEYQVKVSGGPDLFYKIVRENYFFVLGKYWSKIFNELKITLNYLRTRNRV